MTKTVTVDIWSDVMCPWCAIGYTQFLRAVEQVEGEIEVETRFMPFELNPDMPPEGKEQDKHLAEVYGRSLEDVAAMRTQLLAAADRAGFPMQFGDPAMMWNTFDAHKLLRWALATGGPQAQGELKLALLRAHFQQVRPIGDREELLNIAAEAGFDRSAAAEALDEEALTVATRMEEQRGVDAGISSVPSFVFQGKYLVTGARDAADYASMLRQVAGLEQAA